MSANTVRLTIDQETSLPRFVVFLDVLGFRELVKKHELRDLVHAYDVFFDTMFAAASRRLFRRAPVDGVGAMMEAVERDFSTVMKEKRSPTNQEVRDLFRKSYGWNFFILSDSLVYYSNPLHSHEEQRVRFEEAVFLTRVAVSKFYKKRLPVRGGMAMGELHADSELGIFCGRALVEAYDTSESQEWLGASLGPSCAPLAEEVIKDFDNVFANPPQDYSEQYRAVSTATAGIRPGWDILKYPVPFKSGVSITWAVNWASECHPEGSAPSDHFDSVLTGNPKVDIKYRNTLEFINTWSQHWK